MTTTTEASGEPTAAERADPDPIVQEGVALLDAIRALNAWLDGGMIGPAPVPPRRTTGEGEA